MDIAWVEVWQRLGICKRIYGSHFLYWERIFCKLKLFSIFTCCQWNKWAINGPVHKVFLRLSIGEKSVVYYGKIYIFHITKWLLCFTRTQEIADAGILSKKLSTGGTQWVWQHLGCRTANISGRDPSSESEDAAGHAEFLLSSFYTFSTLHPPHCFTHDYSAINLNIGHYILNISHTDDFRISWK